MNTPTPALSADRLADYSREATDILSAASDDPAVVNVIEVEANDALALIAAARQAEAVAEALEAAEEILSDFADDDGSIWPVRKQVLAALASYRGGSDE